MVSPPFALSVHSLLSSTGADAGFAAIAGLAIMVLLFFAQARETSNLRSSLEHATEQIESLEARLQAVARAQAAAQTAAAVQRATRPGVPSPAAAAMAASVRTRFDGVPAPSMPALGGLPLAALPPSAPAFAGAPALGAATRLIPVRQTLPSVPDVTPALPAADVTAVVSPAAAAAAAAAAATLPAAATAAAATAAGNGEGVPHGGFLAHPLSASGASAGVHPADATLAVPPPPGFAGVPAPAAAAGHPAGPLGSGPAVPPPRVSIRKPPPPSAARKVPPRLSEPRRATTRSLGARVAPFVIGLAALVVGAAAIYVATRPSGSSASASQPAPTTTSAGTHPKHPSKVAPFNPATVTVAVLNGTDIAKLASDTGQHLATMGYKEGTIHDAPNQTHTTTIVAYVADNRSDAVHVAQALKLPTSSVQAVDSATLAVACPPPSAQCAADVVVTIGQNLASKPTSTSTSTT